MRWTHCARGVVYLRWGTATLDYDWLSHLDPRPVIGRLSRLHASHRFIPADGSAAVEPIALSLHAAIVCSLISLHHSGSSTVFISPTSSQPFPLTLLSPMLTPSLPHPPPLPSPPLPVRWSHPQTFLALRHVLDTLSSSSLTTTIPPQPPLLCLLSSRPTQNSFLPHSLIK